MKDPDWGYASFGIGVVTLGVGLYVASMGSELIGLGLIALGAAVIAFSLVPSIVSLWRKETASVSADVRVTRLDLRDKGRLDDGREVRDYLELEIEARIYNATGTAITARATQLELVVLNMGLRRSIPAQFFPAARIAPTGKIADFDHFPEGQYTIPATSERTHYFYFQATSASGWRVLENPRLRLRLTMRLPEPREYTLQLPAAKA